MSHAASEVRVVVWRYLHAASSECAMQCKKGTQKSGLSRELTETHGEKPLDELSLSAQIITH